MPQRRRLIAPALLLMACAACATPTPQQTLDAYGLALLGNDPEAAYALLAPDVKADVSLDDFKASWPAYRNQLLSAVPTLQGTTRLPARLQASVAYSSYDTLDMELRDGAWVITQGAFTFADQSTPRRALIAFLKAMEGRRYDLILRLVPSEYATHMNADMLREDFETRKTEIDALIEALRAGRDNPIQVARDRAYMQYGTREMIFVREGRVWKIESPG